MGDDVSAPIDFDMSAADAAKFVASYLISGGRMSGTTNTRTWMADTTAIHGNRFSKICLPASHDSGTYALKNSMSPQYGEGFQNAVNDIIHIGQELDAIPALNRVINPGKWLDSIVLSSIHGLCATTTRTIAQQLDDGIRCLDLRICCNTDDPNEFYTYHGLFGSKMSDVLTDIREFLDTTAGEVVYVTMGHWEGFDSKSRYRDFSDLVKDYLGDWAHKRKGTVENPSNSPFNVTYDTLVPKNADGSRRSLVILVNGKSHDPVFWPESFSPPNNEDNGTVIAGYYTDTTDLETMLSTQRQQQQSAGDKPFALYMTLTPNVVDYGEIIAANLYESLLALAGVAYFVPFLGWVLSEAILAVAAAAFVDDIVISWRSIKDLSAPIDKGLGGLIRDKFVQPGEANNISFLYIDYYEDSEMVDLAIALSLANADPNELPSFPVATVNQYSYASGGVTYYAFLGENPGGWTFDREAFRVYSKSVNGVDDLEEIVADHLGSNEDIYRLFVSPAPVTEWESAGYTFYAFKKAAPGLAPVYEYTSGDSSSPRYFYSLQPRVDGWTRNDILFYALYPSLAPVFELTQTVNGQTLYLYSTDQAEQYGYSSSYGSGDGTFLASKHQQGDTVPIYLYMAEEQTTCAFRLSSYAGGSPGYRLDNIAFYAFPNPAPGLAAIREFSKAIEGGTIYRYSAYGAIGGWTRGDVVFYATLPDPAWMGNFGQQFQPTDIAALALHKRG